MYPSLAAAKAAVIAVGEEIATFGLPSGICPIVFVFTGVGNGNCDVDIFLLIFTIGFYMGTGPTLCFGHLHILGVLCSWGLSPLLFC